MFFSTLSKFLQNQNQRFFFTVGQNLSENNKCSALVQLIFHNYSLNAPGDAHRGANFTKLFIPFKTPEVAGIKYYSLDRLDCRMCLGGTPSPLVSPSPVHSHSACRSCQPSSCLSWICKKGFLKRKNTVAAVEPSLCQLI